MLPYNHAFRVCFQFKKLDVRDSLRIGIEDTEALLHRYVKSTEIQIRKPIEKDWQKLKGTEMYYLF